MSEIIFQENTDLKVEIPGTIEIGGNIYKRKLHVTTLIYNPQNKGVLTEAIVKFYLVGENGEFGELAPCTTLIKDYPIRMIADNTTICDVQTGIPICQVGDQKFDESGEETEDSPTFGKYWSKQFEWFYNVAQNVPVKINEMIGQFFLYHASIGKID